MNNFQTKWHQDFGHVTLQSERSDDCSLYSVLGHIFPPWSIIIRKNDRQICLTCHLGFLKHQKRLTHGLQVCGIHYSCLFKRASQDLNLQIICSEILNPVWIIESWRKGPLLALTDRNLNQLSGHKDTTNTSIHSPVRLKGC